MRGPGKQTSDEVWHHYPWPRPNHSESVTEYPSPTCQTSFLSPTSGGEKNHEQKNIATVNRIVRWRFIPKPACRGIARSLSFGRDSLSDSTTNYLETFQAIYVRDGGGEGGFSSK